MTRINLVPPDTLCDQHLRGEWHELPRVFTLSRAFFDRGDDPQKLPTTFRLGTGHARFFYNKLDFLFDRLLRLQHEMVHRGYDINPFMVDAIMADKYHPFSRGGWTPSSDDIRLSKERILVMMPENPIWTNRSAPCY